MSLLPTDPVETYWAGLSEFIAIKDRAQRRNQGIALSRWRRAQISEASQSMLINLVAEPEWGTAWQQWFWFNHFNVLGNKQQIGAVLHSYLQKAIGQHMQGSFADLLKAVTMHPAMLMYLDNVRNVKGRGNENHARELLELHTLGVGEGYDQADVVAAAEIMTGWGVSLRGDLATMGTTAFNARQHEGGAKRVLNRTFEANGEGELPALLEHLAAQPATAKHLAKKIAVWLLGDEPREGDVARLAQVYLQTGGHLPALWKEAQRLQQALRGDTSNNSQGAGKFKDPLRYVASSAKLLLGSEPVTNAKPLERWLRLLGEPMFYRGSPDGYPLGGNDWLSAGQLSQRVELAQEMVATAPNLGNASAIRQRLQDGPMASPQAKQAILRLPEQHRATLEKARDPALGWALLLASPSFMYV